MSKFQQNRKWPLLLVPGKEKNPRRQFFLWKPVSGYFNIHCVITLVPCSLWRGVTKCWCQLFVCCLDSTSLPGKSEDKKKEQINRNALLINEVGITLLFWCVEHLCHCISGVKKSIRLANLHLGKFFSNEKQIWVRNKKIWEKRKPKKLQSFKNTLPILPVWQILVLFLLWVLYTHNLFISYSYRSLFPKFIPIPIFKGKKLFAEHWSRRTLQIFCNLWRRKKHKKASSCLQNFWYVLQCHIEGSSLH